VRHQENGSTESAGAAPVGAGSVASVVAATVVNLARTTMPHWAARIPDAVAVPRVFVQPVAPGVLRAGDEPRFAS
jgi:hypothetical protein